MSFFIRSIDLFKKYASPAPKISSIINISGTTVVEVEKASRAYIPAEYVFTGLLIKSSSSENSTISSYKCFASEPVIPL
ncbi:hypothetical protein D3C86_2112530 [compost metagenome]